MNLQQHRVASLLSESQSECLPSEEVVFDMRGPEGVLAVRSAALHRRDQVWVWYFYCGSQWTVLEWLAETLSAERCDRGSGLVKVGASA